MVGGYFLLIATPNNPPFSLQLAATLHTSSHPSQVSLCFSVKVSDPIVSKKVV